MFFSFDGVDGAGKSTQFALFCNWLRDDGHDVLACRDPGGTPLGERIREILLARGAKWDIHRRTEMFLYMASRAQLVEECVRPALQAGKVVVTDRFVLANIVYQGYAGGLDIDQVRRTGKVCTAGIEPDCIFVLDIAPQDARKRVTRELDRMEQQGEEFQQRLRDGFLQEAAISPGKAHVIDAARPIDVIQQEIRAIARRMLAQEGFAGSQHAPA